MRFLSPLLSILLTPLMACTPVLAQAPALGSSMAATTDTVAASLQLRMAEDDGGTAAAGSRLVKGFTVEVTDSGGAPVQNAAVVFRLPDSGPSAKFADGTLAAVAYTDAQGRAHVKAIQWGGATGTVALRITAVKDTMHAGLLFEENLTAMPPLPVAQGAPMMPRQESVPAQAVPITRIQAVVVENRAVQPGQLSSKPPVVTSFAADNDDSPEANVPARGMVGAESSGGAPGVSITTSGAASSGGGHSKTKWIVIAAVAAAGAGAALAFVHKGSGSSSSSSGVSIGSPSVSVGHP